jgi:pimeloyl-ACP methyl ester carboxylesterase
MTRMRVVRGMSQSLRIVLLLLLTGTAASAQTPERRVRNIVLVHGSWADGSGWKGVYDILVNDGYNVSIVQEPETSFKEDVAAAKRVLSQQDGPCVLVAHSYGGAVITEAGTHPSVVGLVYVAAHMPDAGESQADAGKRFPSDLSKSNAIKMTADGFTYLDPAQFMRTSQPICLLSRPLLWRDRRCSTQLTISTRSSPRRHGEANQAGCWWRGQTEPSTPTLNGGMPPEPTATRSKSRAPATRSTSPGRRRLQL